MRTRHLGILDVGPLRRSHAPAEGQIKAHVPGATALGIGRGRDIRGTVGVEEVLHPVPTVPMGEEGEGLGAVPGLDPLEVRRPPRSGPRPRKPPRTPETPGHSRRIMGFFNRSGS